MRHVADTYRYMEPAKYYNFCNEAHIDEPVWSQTVVVSSIGWWSLMDLEYDYDILLKACLEDIFCWAAPKEYSTHWPDCLV